MYSEGYCRLYNDVSGVLIPFFSHTFPSESSAEAEKLTHENPAVFVYTWIGTWMYSECE